MARPDRIHNSCRQRSVQRLFHWMLSLLIIFTLGCTRAKPTSYPFTNPDGFVKMIVPENNPTTVEGVALGRQLFFDPILSADSTISCGSCHQPGLAFTDGTSRSSGLDGRLGRRSAPSLLNIGFHYKGVFWDGRSPNLEDQALHPLTDELEMGIVEEEVVEKRLKRTYQQQFESAFPGETINLTNTAKALAQFQRTLISADSKYDQVLRGEAQFSPAEKRGWTIFFDAGYPETPMAECSHCHTDPLFTNLAFANNGLDSSQTLLDFSDTGLGAITNKRYDNGKFRVPTLRNIAITSPYMHDGRFDQLEEVIHHYNTGGQYAENADANVRPLALSVNDQQDLIAFLQTLTDTAALTNPNYFPSKK